LRARCNTPRVFNHRFVAELRGSYPGADESGEVVLVVFVEPLGQNQARGVVGRVVQHVREQGGAVVQQDAPRVGGNNLAA